VQDRPAARRRASDLSEPETQATAGMKIGSSGHRVIDERLKAESRELKAES
jgi:hypothetical protein